MLMSEKGSEPDIEPCGFNVAEVPNADLQSRPRGWLQNLFVDPPRVLDWQQSGAIEPQWPPNPKKVRSNCSFSPLTAIAQNRDANTAPSKNQANF